MEENVDASAALAHSLAQISVDCPWCPKGIKQRNLRSNHRSDSDSEEEDLAETIVTELRMDWA